MIDPELAALTVGPAAAETFRTATSSAGGRGVTLVISDAHEGLKPAVSKVVGVTRQRCRVHCMRYDTAHAGKPQHRSDVGSIFRNAGAITRPVGAVLLDQSEE